MWSEIDIKAEVIAVGKICDGSHQNIIKVFGHDRLRNTPYYFFDIELCDVNVSDFLQQAENNSLPAEAMDLEQQILKIVADIAAGLVYIHSQGVVHRDLKPTNGIITIE